MAIDTGDYVHHGPTGEKWVVAGVEGDRLYWCGYPFGGSAELCDCTLVQKATEQQRNKLIHELAHTTGDARPIILAQLREQEA